jgi:hypothetical protein
MVSKTIPCQNAASETSALEAAGAINIACTPIAGQEGFCTITWEWPVLSQRKPIGAFRPARFKRHRSNPKPIRRSRTHH